MEKINQIVILPSTKKRQEKQIFFLPNNNRYYYLGSDTYKPRDQKVFLYVLSDQTVNPGDWYYYKDDEGYEHIFNYPINGIDNTASKGKKIIASTDIELGLPTLKDEQIKKFLDNYNDTKILGSVIVQYEGKQVRVSSGYQTVHVPIVDLEDNSLVLEIKMNWTEEQKREIEKLIRTWASFTCTGQGQYWKPEDLDNWIIKNL